MEIRRKGSNPAKDTRERSERAAIRSVRVGPHSDRQFTVHSSRGSEKVSVSAGEVSPHVQNRHVGHPR
jgi:hypothetical protein